MADADKGKGGRPLARFRIRWTRGRTGAETGNPFERRLGPSITVIALLGGLVGLAGGGYGLYTGWRSEFPKLDVAIEHVAPANERVLQLDVVNSSPRAVSLVRGEVRFDGERVGNVVAIQEGTPPTAGLQDPDLLDNVKRLPYPVAGGESFAGVIVWDEGESSLPDVVERFTRALGGTRRSGEKPTGRSEVTLEFEPGGQKTEQIGLRIGTFRIRRFPGHAAGWYSEPVLDGKTQRVRGISVVNNNNDPVVARLELWSRRSAVPIRAIERPISIHGRTRFMFLGLKPGRYEWALSTGGRVPAVGDFVTPCPEAGRGASPAERCSGPIDRFR